MLRLVGSLLDLIYNLDIRANVKIGMPSAIRQDTRLPSSLVGLHRWLVDIIPHINYVRQGFLYIYI